MVKLKGPGLATGASGSIGKTVTFSNWKGRPYLKMHAEPAQPNTLPQQSMKIMMAWLAIEWQNLTPDDAATWDEPADPKRVSRFNAFQAVNLARWRNFLAPSMPYPATEDDVVAAEQAWNVVTLGNHARLRMQIASQNDGWAVTFYRINSAVDPGTWHQLIHSQHMCGFCWHEFDFYPDESGTYYFAFRCHTIAGKWSRANPRFMGQATLTV